MKNSEILNNKITTIVVSFNRKDILLKCLDGILKQTIPLDHIFIIDNASTDGTADAVKNKFGSNELITLIQLDKNTGSAGGFHEGAKRAYEWGAEWIWFLDDDVSPRTDCLEIMLKYKNISKCIHPSKVDINNKEFLWEYIFDSATGKATSLNNLSFKNGKEFTFVNIGCFEGMLIHRDIISKIGYPDKRFFIAGDDTIYGFLASLYTNVIYVKNAVINKLLPISDTISPTFLYYSTRNQFLIKEYLKKYSIFHKNLFYTYLFLAVIRSSFYYTFKNKSLYTPIYIIKGVIDGLRGVFYKMQ